MSAEGQATAECRLECRLLAISTIRGAAISRQHLGTKDLPES
jgi:hypothetical protein